uniref:SSD domain-containing protein n=1 Tax=Plectus sambesii TaxID=2011161 RepID=A0A914WWF6_9BILA
MRLMRNYVGDFYGTLGFSIGSHPYVYLASSVAISLALLSGLIRVQLVDDIRTGYSQEGSPSLRERAIFTEYSNFTTSPYGMAIMAVAKDGGSMLREQHLAEVVRLSKFALYDLNVTVDGNPFTFQNVCKNRCKLNYGVEAFMNSLNIQRELQAAGKPLNPEIILDYPQSFYGTTKLMTSYYFYGVRRAEHPSSDAITPIEHVWLIAFWFFGEKGEGATFEAVKNLEMKLYDISVDENETSLLDVHVYGDEIANREVLQGAQNIFWDFLAGFALMFAFVAITVSASAPVGERLTTVNFILVSTAILSPLLAAGSMLGFLSALGYNVNSIMCMTPFLILGIGVDDAFLIIHSWRRHVQDARQQQQQQQQRLTVADRMSASLRDVGPSITITSITNTLAFAIGALTPTPQIRMFCIGTALAVFADFILELCLFSSMLAIVGGRPTTRRRAVVTGPAAVRQPSWTEKFLRSYCRFLTSWPAIIGGFLFAVGLWTMSIYGITRMTTTFSPEKTFSSDSKLRESIKVVERMYDEQMAVTIIMNKPPDISNATEYQLFYEAIATLEGYPNSCEPERNQVWLRQYEKFDREAFQLASAWSDENYTLSYDSLPEYLHDDPMASNSVKYYFDKNGKVQVERMGMLMCFKNMSQWADRSKMIIEWRKVSAKYSNFNMTVFIYDATLYDVILNVNSVTIRAIVITLLCMAGVCMFFIPSVCSVIVASACIVSISIAVVGFLSWLGMDMDPITMVNILMAVGFNVDYTAHISYHFHKTGASSDGIAVSKAERLYGTLSAVGFPMIQAGISTAICVLPLIFNDIYIFLAFVNTICLVVGFGLVHGLFILPVVLAALPGYCTGGGKCTSRRENLQSDETMEEMQAINNDGNQQ